MRPVVIKIGGGLLGTAGALDAACRAVGRAGERHPVLVVPGGGPFADAVRAFDRDHGLSPSAAHWMAILAMDQYAYALAERIAGARLVEAAAAAAEALRAPGVAVLAPSRWMRAADVLPHGWDVTGDSIAAFVARALGVGRLVLIKPSGVKADTPGAVDGRMASSGPAGLDYDVVGCDDLVRLLALLDGRR